MSYVVQVWEHPVPATFEEADRINSELQDQHCPPNPKFRRLAKRLMALFPEEDGDSVWTDLTLDGECDQPVYGIGVLTQHLETVMPHLFHVAGELGLVVYDMQAGDVHLPGNRVLDPSVEHIEPLVLPPLSRGDAQPGSYNTSSGGLSSREHILAVIHEQLDPLLHPAGFATVRGPKSQAVYVRKLRDCEQRIRWGVDDHFLHSSAGAKVSLDLSLVPTCWNATLRKLAKPWQVERALSIWFNLAALESASGVVGMGQIPDYSESIVIARQKDVEGLLVQKEAFSAVFEKRVLPLMDSFRTFADMDRLVNEGVADAKFFGHNLACIPVAFAAGNPRFEQIAARTLAAQKNADLAKQVIQALGDPPRELRKTSP